MHDDVLAKLAKASSPEEVQSVLDECGMELAESGEPDGDEATVEPPKKPGPPKAFGTKLSDSIDKAMKGPAGEAFGG